MQEKRDKKNLSLLCVVLATLIFFLPQPLAIELREGAYHVFPGQNIQQAIDAAARHSEIKTVKVHAGEYNPSAKRQALIWFNKHHDGVKLEAIGPVTLTAANAALSRPSSPSHPAVVNHVVYFGHGITTNTVLRGFRITGANAYVTDKFMSQLEPDKSVPKNSFFLTDGGAIKVFGQSSPIIDQVEIVANYTSPCGAGISVQQQGRNSLPVIIRNSVFRANKTQVTGAAIDLLEGSAAEIINCLFVQNISNTGEDIVAKRAGGRQFTNSGVLTIFQNSRALVRNCTFTGNRNAVDDLGKESSYLDSIFYKNDLPGGLVEAKRYELDLQNGALVRGCLINGKVLDPRSSISPTANTLDAPDPKFDEHFVPRSETYSGAGYRPVR